MAWYSVQVSVREQGAIGAFRLDAYRVRAESYEVACKYATDDAVVAGYETRGCGPVTNLDTGEVWHPDTGAFGLPTSDPFESRRQRFERRIGNYFPVPVDDEDDKP